tara:strand:+ start:389 stop:2302 length:1914 start_codon:yes stop_codon:yes gene_type:complete
MCGIAGQVSLSNSYIEALDRKLSVMSQLINHRGPDDSGIWMNQNNSVGLVHRRLSIIDLSKESKQPMHSNCQSSIVFNGEIYNYIELKNDLKRNYKFRTSSDTESILSAYAKYQRQCLNHFRGMFSFAIWDEKDHRLFCARDRFGIKPFYYLVKDKVFYFASEVKALLPFLSSINTHKQSLAEYLTFQYNIGENTLFEGIKQLLPGHSLIIQNGNIKIEKYWDVSYKIDFESQPSYFYEELRKLYQESINLHSRSDVPIGSYLSGGLDSTLNYKLISKEKTGTSMAFHGRFLDYKGYDESEYAISAASGKKGNLKIIDINSNDFINTIEDIIYYLDYPVAGPGAFCQYMVSKIASENVKVVVGGQGGDEMFGGYARYLIAYLEQCLKAAIDGNYKNGNFVVTIESIIPQLTLLKEYKPMVKKFLSQGLFENMEKRYFNLINKSLDFENEIYWNEINQEKVYEKYLEIFNTNNVQKDAYFDKMTHFDFKCLLPSLLQVEDRMSMAHGLESRVPMLDHPLVEFAATIPANIKFKDGKMKYMIKEVFKDLIPNKIIERRDKMGFPVPLNKWFKNELKDFILDNMRSMISKNRPYINSKEVHKSYESESEYSRKTWALLSLELWYQKFHDRHKYWEQYKID